MVSKSLYFSEIVQIVFGKKLSKKITQGSHMVSNDLKLFKMVPNSVKWSQIVPKLFKNGPKYSQIN